MAPRPASGLPPAVLPPHAPGRPRGFTARLRRLILGRPLATSAELSHRLPILLALPVFASDALSSNAYATEEIMLQLVHAGPLALPLVIPISVAISLLMVVVAVSYRRAIALYPTSGGSYTVSRDNLGPLAGLIAGSALTIDYILTVAVSVAAGVAAVTSYAQALAPYRVELALLLVALVALLNLRGTRESGLWFAAPAYAFVGMMLLMLGYALYRGLAGTLTPLPQPELAHGGAAPLQALTAFLVLKAFSSGCAALTGVEAISNGVQAFEPPEARNAGRTLLILVTTSITLFMGLGFAALACGAQPSHSETIVSQIARAAYLGGGLPEALGRFMVGATLASVLAVLVIASNTAFADFPRLLAFMARDGFAPRGLTTLGDRLVYSRGIIVLTVISAALLWAFQASVNLLIPLYAVGVFLCFTLSQAGMLRRMLSRREPGWRGGAALNLVGGCVTGLVMLVIAVTKFAGGAWIIAVLLPALVAVGLAIRRHYDWFAQRMTVADDTFNPLAEDPAHLSVLVLLGGDVHRGTLEGLVTARAIVAGRKSASLSALHVELSPAQTARLRRRWEQLVVPYLGRIAQLEVLSSPSGRLVRPVVEHVQALLAARPEDRLVVLIPEFETGSPLARLLHNQTAVRLRHALMRQSRVTLITSRFFLRRPDGRRGSIN